MQHFVCVIDLRPTKGDTAGSVILCPFTPLAGCGAVAVLPVRCWPMAIVLIEPEHAAG